MKRALRATLAALMGIFGAACVPKTMHFSNQMAETRSVLGRSATDAAPLRCDPAVGAVDDARSEGRGLGDIAQITQIEPTDMVAWVRSGLELMVREQAQRWPEAVDASLPDVQMDAELLKSYINLYASVKSATVVLRLRFRSDGQLLSEKIYRGNRSFVNWSMSEREMQAALDATLREILSAAYQDLAAVCRDARPPSAALP